MNWQAFEPLARTVLYEGYVLYPYRPNALKNRRRFVFGTLHPHGTSEEPSSFQLEILIEATSPELPSAALRLCYLHDGIERQIDASAPGLAAGELAGIRYAVTARLAGLDGNLYRLSVLVENRTSATVAAASPHPLLMESAHLRCASDNGAFVSAQDPPPHLAAAAAECRCHGIWPVLVGAPGDRSCLLAAPIILEDYARIAPQSLGDFCDGGEIDEMLMLRVMTLTPDEQAAARAAGGEAARILDRCADAARLSDLHGGVDPLHPSRHEPWSADAAPPESVTVAGRVVKVGDRVRLRPASRPNTPADLFDQLLRGRTARIQAIEQDMDGAIQFAVVAEDDPGADLGDLKQTGHRFFFSLNEVEPL